MSNIKKSKIYLFFIIFLFFSCTSPSNSIKEESFILANGLKIILSPLSKSSKTSIVTLYSIGENHDPIGKSGMAHLIEHLYITAASGDKNSRDINKFISEYPDGWNAQTGSDYTVIATVFSNDRLKSEIIDTAHRMSKLKINKSDLEREIPRIEQELFNMYEGIPNIASLNLASDLVSSKKTGSRKGGIAAEIKKIKIDDLQERIEQYYKPNNAIISIAGNFDSENVISILKKEFKNIKSGEKVKTNNQKTIRPKNKFIKKKIDSNFSKMKSNISFAFQAPLSNSNLYPAFLLLASRLQSNASILGEPDNIFPVKFAPIDLPEVLTISLSYKKGEDSSDIIKKIEKFVYEEINKSLDSNEIKIAEQIFSFQLGLLDLPDRLLANNVYGLAFSKARRVQMGINSKKLKKSLNSLREEDLQKVRENFFNEKAFGVAVVELN